MKKQFLCRPDDNHWCVECCQGREGCPLLGDTGDGKMGCLGHNKKRTKDGLTQTSFCQSFDCLDFVKDREEMEIIRQTVINLPPGQFKMSEVIKIYKDEDR